VKNFGSLTRKYWARLKLILGRNTLAYFGIFAALVTKKKQVLLHWLFWLLGGLSFLLPKKVLKKKYILAKNLKKPKINQESVLW
jgi:hypothetical protein